MAHCINTILVKKDFVKESNDIKVNLPKDIVALPEIVPKKAFYVLGENVKFLQVDTDYFGGCGNQSATLYQTTIDGAIILKEYDSINQGLKDYEVINDKNTDEFDTITLGRYRRNFDFVEESLRIELGFNENTIYIIKDLLYQLNNKEVYQFISKILVDVKGNNLAFWIEIDHSEGIESIIEDTIDEMRKYFPEHNILDILLHNNLRLDSPKGYKEIDLEKYGEALLYNM